MPVIAKRTELSSCEYGGSFRVRFMNSADALRIVKWKLRIWNGRAPLPVALSSLEEERGIL
jgi:hypothetical protein